MSYRISSSIREDGGLIRVEGVLDRDGAAALRREYYSAETTVLLDLSGLGRADLKGIEVLQSLVADGAEITGASPYIRLLLKERQQ